jgi:hypothetical protein
MPRFETNTLSHDQLVEKVGIWYYQEIRIADQKLAGIKFI